MPGDPELVVVAQRAHRCETGMRSVIAALGRSYLYTRTSPEAPRLHVADLGDRGRWASVFTTTARLTAAVGECDAIGMPGLDFLEFTPAGVGLVLDPLAEHALPLPARVIEQAATTLGIRRAT